MDASTDRSSGAAPQRRIHLDHAASTPLLPEASEAMRPFLEPGAHGNASSPHAGGRAARAAVEGARDEVARLLDAPSEEIVFTSGGTEALNLAVKGTARARRSVVAGRLRIVTTAAEQIAVLHPVASLEREGFEAVRIPVEPTGIVDPDRLAAAIDDRTALVAIQHANPEVGVVQPVAAITRAARARGVPVVCDATASAGLLPLSCRDLGADLLAVAARRFGGPAGAGALRLAPGVRLRPEIEGGTQEGGLRAGAENVAGIAGMGAAARRAREALGASAARLALLGERLSAAVLAEVPAVRIVSPAAGGLPGLIAMVIEGLDGEALVALLDERGISASTGSACASWTGKPSHILLAMGLSPETARGSLLFTLGPENEEGEIDRAVGVLREVVASLRGLGGPLGAPAGAPLRGPGGPSGAPPRAPAA